MDIHCVSEKRHRYYINFVITWSDVIQFLQLLVETYGYPREFETSIFDGENKSGFFFLGHGDTAHHVSILSSYCTL